MIIDSLKNSARYESLNPYFKQAFDYLKTNDLSRLEAGKVVLVDDVLIVNINDTQLKNKADAKLETHVKYIDIQVPVSVSETFGWKERSQCTKVIDPYHAEKDVAFYDDVPTTYFTLKPLEFVIFFPEDGHAPCVGEGDIKKIIIKIICV